MSMENQDIRKQVEANRGVVKKLELLIPGLRGYRKLEDIRVSDEMVRTQVADKLDQAKGDLEDLRKQLVSKGDFADLATVGSLIAELQQFSGQVRHSQQGYSGIAPSIRIDEDKLNKLYECDFDFVDSSFQLENGAAKILPASGTLASAVSSVASSLAAIKKKWAVRMETIEGVLLGQGGK